MPRASPSWPPKVRKEKRDLSSAVGTSNDRKSGLCNPTCIQCGSLRGAWTFGELPHPTVHLAPFLPQFQSGVNSEPRTVLAPEGASGDQTWSPGTCSPVATAVPVSRGTEADLEGVVLPGLSWLSGVYWEDHQGPLFCALLNPGVCVGDRD
ncbi:hypothetical protein ACRRTK_008032 [Alexandromys fortis]